MEKIDETKDGFHKSLAPGYVTKSSILYCICTLS